jgi:hypothetical protein
MKPSKTALAILLAWLLALVPRAASAQGIHERFDEIVARAAQETGFCQIRTINLKINALLNETTRPGPKADIGASGLLCCTTEPSMVGWSKRGAAS